MWGPNGVDTNYLPLAGKLYGETGKWRVVYRDAHGTVFVVTEY